MLAVTLFGPALMPADPFEIVSAPMEPPGAEFLLGTDYLGRDVLTGLVTAAAPRWWAWWRRCCRC